jgi:hypothetical protein
VPNSKSVLMPVKDNLSTSVRWVAQLKNIQRTLAVSLALPNDGKMKQVLSFLMQRMYRRIKIITESDCKVLYIFFLYYIFPAYLKKALSN